MRIIDFRAWDKENKVMLGKYDEVNERLGKDEWWGTTWDIFMGTLSNLSEDKNIILMQYTGLKDKNGKEIYEGDMVQIDHHWDSDWADKPHEVNYDNGSFFPWGTGDWEEISDKWEIIGNIYENPELL